MSRYLASCTQSCWKVSACRLGQGSGRERGHLAPSGLHGVLALSLVLYSLKDDRMEEEVFSKEDRSEEMAKILRARGAQDEKEERQVRKLATSHHGPADWILHARMVARSWDGERVEAIAKELHCRGQTVRRRLHRFDAEGIEGLGDRPKAGRPRRLTAADDSQIIAQVRQAPPGQLVTQKDGAMVARDEQGSAQWSLDALAQAAKEAGPRVKRSQIRTILLREGVRWRQTHSWSTPRDKDFVPKERRSSPTTRSHPRERLPSVPMNSDR
jgi:transposase